MTTKTYKNWPFPAHNPPPNDPPGNQKPSQNQPSEPEPIIDFSGKGRGENRRFLPPFDNLRGFN